MADEEEDTKTVEELEKEQDELLKRLDDADYDWNKNPHIAGMIKDNQAERKSRQSAETELEKLREENAMLSEELTTKKNSSDDTVDGVKDDEYLTVGQAKKLLGKASEEFQSKSSESQRKELMEKLADSEIKAKEEFTTKKYGEGLDYLSVLEGYKRIIAQNPAYQQVMLNAKNPAKQAYEIGLLDAEISKKAEAFKNAKFLDKMKTSGHIPKGSGGGGVGLTDKSYDELLNTPASEIMKSLREEEG